MEFQIPKIVHEEVDEQRGVFEIEPLDRGFGYTFGNSLRRVLLSSLEGAAVTSVKIEGVAHEFTTLPGVREDVTDIILNLKNLICRLHGESPEVEVRLQKKGPGVVKASDIQAYVDLTETTQFHGSFPIKINAPRRGISQVDVWPQYAHVEPEKKE